MTNDRLLSKEERDSICVALPNDATFSDELRALYAAQDAKTAKKLFGVLETYIVARYSSPEAGCFIVAICEEDWVSLKGSCAAEGDAL